MSARDSGRHHLFVGHDEGIGVAGVLDRASEVVVLHVGARGPVVAHDQRAWPPAGLAQRVAYRTNEQTEHELGVLGWSATVGSKIV